MPYWLIEEFHQYFDGDWVNGCLLWPLHEAAVVVMLKRCDVVVLCILASFFSSDVSIFYCCTSLWMIHSELDFWNLVSACLWSKKIIHQFIRSAKVSISMVLIEVPYICVVMMTLHNFMESGRKLRKNIFYLWSNSSTYMHTSGFFLLKNALSYSKCS